MADYKELLRRAISALPENNGAARRAVYEKARSALVGQLRAINPPLPARDITQHRLQLEDCIRQVEQEASEANITLARDLTPPSPRPPVPRPPDAEDAAPAPPQPAPFSFSRTNPGPVTPTPEPEPEPVIVAPVAAAPADAQTAIEDIIAAAESATITDAPDEPAADEPVPEPLKIEPPIPLIINRVEANRSGPTSPVPQAARPVERFSLEQRREPAAPLVTSTRPEPIRPATSGASALQQLLHPVTPVPNRPVETALSTVREVEVEPVAASNPAEAEVAIERAIETLDREARGEKTAMLPEIDHKRPALAAGPAALDEDRDEPEPVHRGTGLTIFLVVFALLLVGAGGAGYWAFNQGYIKLDQMFGNSSAAIAEAQSQTTTAATPTLDSATDTTTVPQTNGPGNTASSTPDAGTQPTLDGLEPQERLTATPSTAVPSANTATPSTAATTTTTPATTTGDERLPEETPTQIAANDPAASVDPAVLAGSQSLLLEASTDGKTGAVPFSGTVDWSEGVDEIGLPTLVGKASIPARNLSLDLILRKNADPSLPASHLMEVNFQVSDSFIGGTIAGLPGVLLKNEELVQGTPLVGASARVVGSSFLFALSAADKDVASNTDLLTSRKWIDFAVIYGTGTRAIITLEKDDKAQALFTKVFSAWAAAK